MLQELGITYAMLKQLIATNEQAQLEWDLCIELERANPLLDIMAAQLGITSEQLDGLFRYANGEITIEQFREISKEPVVNNSETVVEQNSVADSVTGEEIVNNEN
jgi:glutamate 5-kinase